MGIVITCPPAEQYRGQVGIEIMCTRNVVIVLFTCDKKDHPAKQSSVISQHGFYALHPPAPAHSSRTSEGPDGLSGLGGGLDAVVAFFDTQNKLLHLQNRIVTQGQGSNSVDQFHIKSLYRFLQSSSKVCLRMTVLALKYT